MKSFKEFILNENEEKNKYTLLYKELKDANSTDDIDADNLDKIKEISDVDLDGVEDEEEFRKLRIKALRKIEEKMSGKEPEKGEEEEKDLETDINGLKKLFNDYNLSGKLDNIIKYINGLPKGNNKPRFFEKIVNEVNINCKKSKEAQDAKNAIIFYILLRSLNKKVADKFTEVKEQGGSLSIFDGDVIGGGSLFKSYKNFKNEDVKNFLNTAFDFSSKFSSTIGVNPNGSGNGSLLKLVEKCSELDIDEEGLKTIEKEIDNFKVELQQTRLNNHENTSNDNSSDNISTNNVSSENKVSDSSENKTNDSSENKIRDDSSNNDSNEINDDGSFKSAVRNLNNLNSETPEKKFREVHEKLYGDDAGNLGGYYDKYKQEGLDIQKRNDELHKRTIRQKPVEESAVLSVANNEAYKGIISENILRHLGKTNVSAENTENGPNGWKQCFEDLKAIREKAKTKADSIINMIFKGNVGINEKINLIQKYKTVAFKYRQDLSKSVIKYQKANSLNSFGKLAHDIKVSKNKALDKAERTFKNSSAGKMLEVAEKEITSRVDKLTAESFEKAFNDLYKPVVGHYFANYTNTAITNNKDESIGKTVADAAFDAVLLKKDLFGVGNKSELPLLAEKIIRYQGENSEIEKIKTIVRDWDNNYKSKDAIKPIKDDLEYAKSNPLTNFSHLQIKQYLNAIKPGATIITEGLSNFTAYYYSKILKEGIQWPWQRKNNVQNNAQNNAQNNVQNNTQNNAQNNNQSSPINPKTVRTFALYCLLSSRVTKEFKTDCINYLIKADKTPFSVDDYFKAAEAYKKENANNGEFSKAINSFEANLNVYNNGKGSASEEDNGTNNGANYQNQNTQKNDSETGNSVGAAQEQDTDETTNSASVVTTGAVGSYTIPDRLPKKLRKKMKSRIDSIF